MHLHLKWIGIRFMDKKLDRQLVDKNPFNLYRGTLDRWMNNELSKLQMRVKHTLSMNVAVFFPASCTTLKYRMSQPRRLLGNCNSGQVSKGWISILGIVFFCLNIQKHPHICLERRDGIIQNSYALGPPILVNFGWMQLTNHSIQIYPCAWLFHLIQPARLNGSVWSTNLLNSASIFKGTEHLW